MSPRGTLVITLILMAVCPAWGDESVTWNVALQYEGDHLSILQADQIPPMLKDTMQFGVAASSPVVRYQLEWLDSASRVILSTTMEIGLGLRVPPDCGDGTNQIQGEGAVEFRAIGPSKATDPKKIRLTRLPGYYDRETDLPPAFQWETTELLLPHGGNKDTIPEAILGITKIRDTGEDANRIVLVIMSEGYTQANLDAGLFLEDTEQLVEAWPTYSPWGEYWDLVNIYRVDVVSQEEGGDIPDEGIYVDTFFNASIVDSWRASEAVAIRTTNLFFPAGVVDLRLVLINTSHSGGTGTGSLVTSNTGEFFEDVVLHEMGHHCGELSDEYENSDYVGSPPTNSSNLPNWYHTCILRQLPWKVWVEEGTPLPTPETDEFKDVIGAFEGAGGWPDNVYRPCLECLMRSFRQQFCPICVEGHIMKFVQKVQLAVSLTPSNKEKVVLGTQDQEFRVVPLDVPSLSYQWRLGSQVIEDATGLSLSLNAGDLQSDVGYLYLTITHTSPHIRKTPPFKRYKWVLNKETSDVSQWKRYSDHDELKGE